MNETEARRVAALAGEAVSGPDRSGWFDRLESDRGALAEAVSWFLDRDDADTALRIAVDVWRFWEQRGHLNEGRRIIGMALERGSRAQPGIRGRAYAAATALAFRQGDNDTAASLVETALDLARAADDQRGISSGLVWSARVARRRGEPEVARQRLEEAVAIAATLGDVRAMIEPLHSLAAGERLAGNYAEARRRYEETRALSEQIGNTRGAMIETMNLAAVALLAADVEAADHGAKRALRWAGDTKDARAIPGCVSIVGGVGRLRGEPERAATLLGAAEAALVRGQAAFDPDDSAEHAERVARAIELLGSDRYDQAADTGRAMTASDAVALALDDQPR
ncbi:MAG: tetratricopeptide repeat protein [Chloroflexota bacterium]